MVYRQLKITNNATKKNVRVPKIHFDYIHIFFDRFLRNNYRMKYDKRLKNTEHAVNRNIFELFSQKKSKPIKLSKVSDDIKGEEKK